MSVQEVNNIITGFDKASTTPYNLFSFVDNNQNQYVSFEQEITNMFTNMSSFIASEDSNSCNITNAEEDERVVLKRDGKAEPFVYSLFAQGGGKKTFNFFEKENE